MSKTRVAPIKEQTIPRLELCGAKQLSALITFIANTLDIHKAKSFALCDSTATLGWLCNPPSNGSAFVRNRVEATVSLLPASQWRYVATRDNPADIASCGSMPRELHLISSGGKDLNSSPYHPNILVYQTGHRRSSHRCKSALTSANTDYSRIRT